MADDDDLDVHRLMHAIRPKPLVFDGEFLAWLGRFFGSWATLELMMSYGIFKFLKITEEETHILTSGMEFGRKATLLLNLVYRSGDPNKSQIIGLIRKIQNESKRNVFAHSFITSSANSISFIEQSRGGDYRAVEHKFTRRSFIEHVVSYARYCAELEKALGVEESELARFCRAALSANTKSTKSPVPPSSRA